MTGVVVPFWLDRPPTEAVEVALLAERLGFGEVWVGELYHFDAFGLASHLVARTTSITPVIGPIAATVRDPLTIARGVATVATLGGRPARLALGSSNPTVVGRYHGRTSGGQPARMREVVSVVRSQLDSGRSPTGYRSALGAVGSHISVAASGPRMIAVAGEVSDRLVVNLVTAAQAGALSASVPVPTVAWVVGALEPGPVTRAEVAGQVAHYLAAPGYAEMFEDAGFSELVGLARERMPLAELATRVPEELLSAVACFGSAADIAEGLDRYHRSGVEIALVPATAEDPAGERVMTLVRSLVA